MKKEKVVKVKVVKERKVREVKGATPQETIDRINSEHQDGKDTKQVKYSKDGLKI